MTKLLVSHSGMETYRKCPHKYYLGRVANVQPVEVKRAPAFGTAGHTRLECLVTGHTRFIPTMTAEDSVLLDCLILAYEVRWGIPKGVAEGHFVVPIVAPDGKPDPDIEMQGYIDIETEDYVLDHKFTSANITPTYIKELDRNPQAEEYLIAAQENGSRASYAIWDIIRSTAYKRRTATPEHEREFYKRNGKYGKKGDPKPGTYLEDETWEEFRQRIVDDIAADPDKFFTRVPLRKTEEELDRRRYDIWATAKQIQHSIEAKAFPRNNNSCKDYGGCEYEPVCWDGVDPAQSELYTIGEKRGR